MSDTPPEPDDLRELGERLGEVRRREAAKAPKQGNASSLSVALRFSTELVAALVVGGAVGWGIDWTFGYFGIHTRPVFLIVFFMLGAAAGFWGVIRAAQTMDSGRVAEGSAAEDDEES